jgi:hypothetical protein
MDATTTVSSSSTEFDLSQRIKRPTSWSGSDLIAAEVALTTSAEDDASVYRGDGGCVVDLSSSATTGAYGATANPVNGGSPSGLTNSIFVMNDVTPQLSLQGQIDDVVTALQHVQIRCDDLEDLAGLYVRVGAVPTRGSGANSTECGSTSSNITSCGQLFYVFSTEHYYRLVVSNINDSVRNTTQITNLFNQARSLRIPVDGTVRSGEEKYGWAATLRYRDEIILTNALGGQRMIGTTDMDASWSWDTNWNGTAGSTCVTDEGDFKWLGPDEWCNLVPTWNHLGSNSYGATSRWWLLTGATNGVGGTWSQACAGAATCPRASYTIDFDSDNIPTSIADADNRITNGYNIYHSWHTNPKPDEPNSSGDYIYMGYSGNGGNAGWDDAKPGGSDDRDNGNNGNSSTAQTTFFAEFCSPGDPCPPPAEAVSSTQLKIAQTITFSEPASSYSTQTVNLTAATTTSGLTISYASSDTTICTVSSNAVVTLLAQGICAITASQAGNTDYLAATDVTRTFTSTFGNAFTGLITDCTGAGRLENGSFESPEISGNFQNRADASTANNGGIFWRTTAGDNLIEIWRNPTPLGSAYNTAQGIQFAELNANSFAGLYQDIATIPGTGIRWSLEHRGRDGIDKMRVLIGSATGNTSYSPASGSVVSVPGTFSDPLGEFATPTSGSATRDISDGSNSWRQWRGNYVVPAGQTTTRFLFISFDPASGSTGNLLDNIVFTPTIACPDTTSIISGRSAVNFNVTTNDFFPANSTVSVVSITGTGSATVSGTNLSLSSSSPGSYSVRYRITNPDNDTSESTVNVTVLSESSPRLPDVLLVDPRLNVVDFPQASFENATNLLVCVQESDSGGTILGSPTVSFDVATKGTEQTSGSGSATISGDRTSTLLIRHTRQNVLDTFNSSGGLRAYLSSGNFNSTRYVRVRTLPVATSTSAVTVASCSDAAASASKTIEIRPLELTKTLRKGTIQLKN